MKASGVLKSFVFWKISVFICMFVKICAVACCVWRSESDSVELFLSFHFHEVLGIELRSAGLHSKPFTHWLKFWYLNLFWNIIETLIFKCPLVRMPVHWVGLGVCQDCVRVWWDMPQSHGTIFVISVFVLRSPLPPFLLFSFLLKIAFMYLSVHLFTCVCMCVGACLGALWRLEDTL